MSSKHPNLVRIKCDNCTIEFDKLYSKLKRSKHHYCSLKCCDQHKKQIMKGEGNHRYGTKSSAETAEKKSKTMAKLWQDPEYVEKVLSAREIARSALEHPIGWDPVSKQKRIDTFLRKYGTEHNWSDKEVRSKCDQTTLEKYGKSSLDLARSCINENVIEKRRRTLIETMTGVSYDIYEERLKDREKYYNKVRRITSQQPLHLLENFEKRAHISNNNEAYHLDHIIPICYGWINGIPEEIIADICNLRFIPAIDNIIKSSYYEGKIWRHIEQEIQD
jgi:hypothetical protein